MGKVAVVGIVEDRGKILIGKKVSMNHFLSDAWHIPGGMVEDGESEEEALKREFMEETGIEIKVIRLVDEVLDATKNTSLRWYLCQALTRSLRPGDDLADVRFVPRKEVPECCSKKATALWPPKVKEHFK